MRSKHEKEATGWQDLLVKCCDRALCKVLLYLTGVKADFSIAGRKVGVPSASVRVNKFYESVFRMSMENPNSHFCLC